MKLLITSPAANIRASAYIPYFWQKNNILSTQPQNAIFEYSKKVSGTSVAGNDQWYELTVGGYVWSGNVQEYKDPTAPLVVYSQRDPRWASIMLGTSYYCTIGMYGCTITSIASGVGLNPAQVDDILTRYGGYSNEMGGSNNASLVIWSKLTSIPKIASIELDNGSPFISYTNQKALDAIKAGKLVLAEVNASPIGGADNGKHWVRMLGNGQIMDPWYGDITSTARYQNYYTLRIINLRP